MIGSEKMYCDWQIGHYGSLGVILAHYGSLGVIPRNSNTAYFVNFIFVKNNLSLDIFLMIFLIFLAFLSLVILIKRILIKKGLGGDKER